MNQRLFPPRAHRRRGFTLIELLVVIAIIGVLVSLLLPAVQSAREAARRAQCTNNLSQIALATLNYHAAHEILPPGCVDSSSPVVEGPSGYHFGWMAQILPYVERRAVFDAFNFKVGLYDAVNLTGRQVRINTYLCPSDVYNGGRYPLPAVANYAGCHNDIEAPIASDNHGLLFLNSAIRIEDINDGASSTILIAEKLSEPDLGWASGTRASLRNTGWVPNATKPLTPAEISQMEEDFYTDEGEPDDLPMDPGAEGEADTPPIGGFSSRHPGGVNVAMADGAIRFLKNSLSPSVMMRLGHRADGEIISDDQW